MPKGDQSFDFTDLRGGRNQVDPWETMDADQVFEAMNVDYVDYTVARRRWGSVASPGLTFVSGGPWASIITSWTRYLPGFDETKAEVWAVDGVAMIARLYPGSVISNQWNQMTPKVSFVADTTQVRWLTFNQKLYIFGPTNVNRCQVWDGTTIRYVGQAPGGPPVLASAPAGGVTDTRRYWSTLVVKNAAGVVIRRSELSSTYLELVLTAQQATVVPTVYPGESETHWELWGASKGDGYGILHFIGDAAVGVGVTDNGALTGRSPAPIGTYLLPPSAKYCVADGDRLIFAGPYETVSTYAQTPVKISRIWYTPRLGSLDVSDDERIPITVGNASIPAIRNYLDITEPSTGLGGPVQGSFFAFSYRRTYRLSPTGDVTRPYTRVPLGVPHGAIYDQGICLAEDEVGNSALYVVGIRGPWRIDNNGPVFCGWDIQDLWKTVNLAAPVPCIVIYHPDIHQVWFYVATNFSNTPNERWVFDTRQGKRHPIKGVVHGWTRASGVSCRVYAAAMLPETIGLTMSRVLKPYVSYSGGSLLMKCDVEFQLDDVGNTYQAYIQKIIVPPSPHRSRLGNVWIEAKARLGGILWSSFTRDWGADPAQKITQVPLDPKGSETFVWREFEDSALGDIQQMATAFLGDAGPIATSWGINRWQILEDDEGAR